MGHAALLNSGSRTFGTPYQSGTRVSMGAGWDCKRTARPPTEGHPVDRETPSRADSVPKRGLLINVFD